MARISLDPFKVLIRKFLNLSRQAAVANPEIRRA
jgi:hypothetical protein